MFETILLGAGPGGTGPLVWAAGQNRLQDWMSAGFAIVDQADCMGGTLGAYQLHANSLADSFLECLDGAESGLASLRRERETLDLARWRGALPPLPLVGAFLARMGAALAQQVADSARSRFLPGTRAVGLRLREDGSVAAELRTRGDERVFVPAASALMALGGQPADARRAMLRPGLSLARWGARLVDPDRLLRGHFPVLPGLPADGRPVRAVVIGSSHSAMSAAWVLLERMEGLTIGPGGLSILYRRAPRLFYPSVAAAAAEGYPVAPDDICPATGRVHRLGGLRGDGGMLWRRIAGLSGAPEPRAVAHALDTVADDRLVAMLDEADIIIPAIGYRLRRVPVFAPDGSRIRLAELPAPAVDGEGRLLTASGAPLPQVFGIGLGSGFRPWGALGGEPAFSGQQNSLWLYQHGLGKLIHDGIRAAATTAHAGGGATHLHAAATAP